MLTTFNEIDMSAYMSMRKEFGEMFLKKHSIKLGFMSGFVKATTLALIE
jgi:2-oxoglutarate dehydrogenase E2 component (dihydrolipoamide succinyltransferase)